jgi:hypothetical protein
MCEVRLSKGEAAGTMECEEELQACSEESEFVEFEMAGCDGKVHDLCPKVMQGECHALTDGLKTIDHPQDRGLRGGRETPGRTERTRLDRQGLSCSGRKRRKLGKETRWRGVIA